MALVGLDVGTTGCKAIVFDPDGRVLGCGFEEYGIISDEPHKAEQDAEQVWSQARCALNAAVRASGAAQIKALSLSVQGDAIIPVDSMRAHPINSLIKILWLRDEMPDIWRNTWKVLTVSGTVSPILVGARNSRSSRPEPAASLNIASTGSCKDLRCIAAYCSLDMESGPVALHEIPQK